MVGMDAATRDRQDAPARARRRWRRTGALAAASLLAIGLGATGAAPAMADRGHARPHALVVAPDGNDRATGSARHPLATVAAAVRRLPAGETVEFAGGSGRPERKVAA
jgi:hypothetical protein